MELGSEAQRKVMTAEGAAARVRIFRKEGRRVVFTNGCFDLLHLGHVRYLGEAAALGGCLVVGLNTDRSVREIKGPARPVVPQEERAEVLASLSSVDLVVLFDEADPLRLITALSPDVLVKGGDWPRDKIVGGDLVEQKGGRVVAIPLTAGVSTTTIIERILKLHGGKFNPWPGARS